MNPSFRHLYGKKVFCDSDMVLANFDKFAEEHLGLPFKERWHQLPLDTYLRLEKMPGADKLMGFLKNHFGKNVYVLTGKIKPVFGKISQTEKRDKKIWLHKNFQIPFKRTFVVYKEDKCKFAQRNKNHILIDDKEENIHQWIAAGGTGILYRNADQAIMELKNIIKDV